MFVVHETLTKPLLGAPVGTGAEMGLARRGADGRDRRMPNKMDDVRRTTISTEIAIPKVKNLEDFAS